MNNYVFNSRLKAMGIKKSQLAKILGVAPATISRWGQNPPQYVWAYLDERDKIDEADARVQQLIDRIDTVCQTFSTN